MRPLPPLFCVAAVAATAAAARAQVPDPPKPSLDGPWAYRSFVVDTDDPTAPSIGPWSPEGELNVKTAADGTFEGKLVFQIPDRAGGTRLLPLDVTGEITPADGKTPAGFTALGTVTLGGKTFDNRLKGWFVPAAPGSDETTVRGSITNAGPDLPGPHEQPPFTVGVFHLKRKPTVAGAAGR